MTNVLMCSMWRNDAHRNLYSRAAHLASKLEYYDDMRLAWVVGDSTDRTFDMLGDFVLTGGLQNKIRVISHRTGIEGDDRPARLRRLSRTAQKWIDEIDNETYFMVHESDLRTAGRIVNRFIYHAGQGREQIAGWPTLRLSTEPIFYDVWAYWKDGEQFRNQPPYHSRLNGDDVFQVDSFGSCWMARADALKGFKFGKLAARDACAHLKAQGLELWVDRTIEVVQPKELWHLS